MGKETQEHLTKEQQDQLERAIAYYGPVHGPRVAAAWRATELPVAVTSNPRNESVETLLRVARSESCERDAKDLRFYWCDIKTLSDEIERLRAALDGLLVEMGLEYDGNRKYDVYQVTKGAVEDARKALRGADETERSL